MPRDVFAVSHPSLADTAQVRRVPFAATVETEPNDLPRPQAIASPVALSGRIDPPGDQDVFRLSLRKGDRRVIRVESRALGRPLDPALRVLDAGGKVLAESDDTGRNNRDLERTFTAPSDGEYRLDRPRPQRPGRCSIRLSPERAGAATGLHPIPGVRPVRPDPGEDDEDHRGHPAQGRPGGAHRDRRRGPPGRRHGAAGDIEARGCLGPLGGTGAIGRRIARVPVHFASSAGRRGSLAPSTRQQHRSRVSM